MIFVIGFGPSQASVTIGLACALSPRIARFSRGSLLGVASEPFVAASKLSNTPALSILFRHLIPNALPTTLAYLSGLFGTALVTESSLSFLGLGIPAPFPSLGGMLREGARLYLEIAPWLTIFPGGAIAIIVLLANLSGSE